jgi:hypothetical protein
VLLERIFKREPNIKYPRCLDGKLACPPEDCGSIPGYYDCIEAIKNRDNSEGLLTWLGRWKPYNFNPKLVKFENPRSRFKETLEDGFTSTKIRTIIFANVLPAGDRSDNLFSWGIPGKEKGKAGLYS